MLVSTTNEISGRPITTVLGLVHGNSVRARAIGRDFVAGLRGIVGGDVPEYAELMAQSRAQAFDRMVASAQALGADAIVAVRYNTADVMQGMAEVLAYGTAVRLASTSSTG